MRHPARLLALVACLALAGSTAAAGPSRRSAKTEKAKKAKAAKKAKKAKATKRAPPPVIERDDDDDDDAIEVPAARFGGKRKAHVRERDDDETVALREEEPSPEEEIDDADEIEIEPVRAPRLRKHTLGRDERPKDWHLAIGPYAWASSVDAEISLGSASVGSGVDFMDIQRHARYGAELLSAVSYRRLKLTTDFMYGVIDLEGAKTIGPLMVSLNGSASSLLLENSLSYRVLGDETSAIALEGLAGMRYQRTKIEGTVGIGGSDVASLEKVTNIADALAGARLYLRPTHRLFASGAVDLGVFGDSALTWSASADASVRITSHVLFSVGYRTLTMNGANVSMKMHGPRAALQFAF